SIHHFHYHGTGATQSATRQCLFSFVSWLLVDLLPTLGFAPHVNISAHRDDSGEDFVLHPIRINDTLPR
ncbi:hypothetical protein HAX54_013506, partial [Datura stramonium]|nr:hypothetical protein [Datura stramonium]